MTRNTLRRVEVAAPIEDGQLKAQIIDMFALLLSDNVQAREMQPDGSYIRRQPQGAQPRNAQEIFYQQAYERAAGKQG